MLTINFNIGMGAAAGVYQSVFGLIIILLVNWAVKRNNPEYALF
jgi:putative aldouronate transport system permease protein